MKFPTIERLRSMMSEVDLHRMLAEGGISAAAASKIADAMRKESSDLPRVAVIGETGVGKSSVLNTLFNAGLPISHVRACTQVEREFTCDRGGKLTVFDLPGFGEDIESDRRHLETYRRVLPTVDVALLVLKADNRAISHIQMWLRRLRRQKILDVRRLVVTLKQADLLQPGEWDERINQPSPEQEETIIARREDVEEKLRLVIKLPKRQVVAFSATKAYNVEPLFEAMLGACSEARRWLLAERADLADFNKLVAAE